ncbi:hypothetical protein [Labrys neptuniae]
MTHHYPNTWRDNLVIWTAMPVAIGSLVTALVLIVGQAIWQDRKKL